MKLVQISIFLGNRPDICTDIQVGFYLNFKNKYMVLIRKAEKTDYPKVLELIQELAVFEKQPDAVEITVEDLIRESSTEPPLFYCIVAEIDQKIEGMALFYFRFSTWKGRTLHLEDLIVRQPSRGKGIGEALYCKVMEFARKHNVKRVAWEVLDWNQPAITFYERTGAKVFDDWRVAHMTEEALENYLLSQKSKNERETL